MTRTPEERERMDETRKRLYEANPHLIPDDLCAVCYHREPGVIDHVCGACRLAARAALTAPADTSAASTREAK